MWILPGRSRCSPPPSASRLPCVPVHQGTLHCSAVLVADAPLPVLHGRGGGARLRQPTPRLQFSASLRLFLTLIVTAAVCCAAVTWVDRVTGSRGRQKPSPPVTFSATRCGVSRKNTGLPIFLAFLVNVFLMVLSSSSGAAAIPIIFSRTCNTTELCGDITSDFHCGGCCFPANSIMTL